MHLSRRLRLAASILLWFVLQALGADKYTDENRPYEFGFKIDGQQHRHESKDKDGIIMGEFGFITADDVYHVTVYATDKEGRFKIVSMKNIHLKSDAVSSLGVPPSARQGHALALPPAQPASVQASVIPQQLPKQGGFNPPAAPGPQIAIAVQPKPPPKPASIEPPGRSCSSCSLPTTTTRAPPPVFNQENNYNSPNQFSAPGAGPNNQQAFPPSSPIQQSSSQGSPSGSSYNPQGGQPVFPPSYSGQQNTAQGGSTGSSYNPQVVQQTFTPSSLGQQNIPQSGPSVSSYNPQGSQPDFPPSTLGQQNIAQGGPSKPSSSPQGSQPAFPPSSSGQQNIAQGGSSAPSYNPQGSQLAFPPSTLGQQNIAQGGPSRPSSSSQGSQPAFPPSSFVQQNIAQSGPSVSSYSQGNQQSYPSGQQNIPQQELVAPVGTPSFAPQPGQTAQNYPGSPNNNQVPGASNVPNAQQRGAFPLAGQSQSGAGQKASSFGGNNNPYAGAGPNGSPKPIPDAGLLSQNNAKQADLPNALATGQTSSPQGGAGERTAKQYIGPEQQYVSGPSSSQGSGVNQGGPRGSAKPTLFSAQMQIVDKNTDIYALGPNEQRGLPPGLSQGDMTQLLYTFNYTLGFHGHFEEGYSNGVKKGYYFVTGRNGVRTRIDYVADETGFHPKVSQEVLDLLSEEVPKPETEKDEKYGLKGYEFKWLYYPVEPKRR